MEFVEWVKNFSNFILVAHNGTEVDFPVLMSVLHCLNRTVKLPPDVSGSLCVFSRKPFLESRITSKLEKEVLNTSYAAYDATENLKILGLLMKQTTLSGP